MARCCPLTDLYRRLGQDFGELQPATGASKAELKGEIVLAPPGALRERWSRRMAEPMRAIASGWMGVRARARQAGAELPLVISDHADWDELTATIREVGAGEIWVTHGREEALVHYAPGPRHQGPGARLLGYDDEE